jgi:hypothetical protein
VDALGGEDLVGLRRGRRVGALDHHAGVHGFGVVGVDHAAERRGDEQLALEREQLLWGDRLDSLALELGQLAAGDGVSLQRLGVEPRLGVDGAAGV